MTTESAILELERLLASPPLRLVLSGGSCDDPQSLEWEWLVLASRPTIAVALEHMKADVWAAKISRKG